MASDAEVRVGLEVHQQLSSPTKLFCACPVRKTESFPYSFTRRLRPAQSELGKVDPAAMFEFVKGKEIQYLWSPESSCLVEADEEPPHAMGEESLEAGLVVSETLGSRVVEEVHVMRKIVIDGSNTGGFQRTAVVGLGGKLMVDGVAVGVQSVTVEEDAARIVADGGGARKYGLDRLGVPLVEVALDPVTGTPEFVGRVALSLGRTLRSTGRVARGLGTIRQDLNVSVRGGAVVEVKGVQKLNLLPRVVEYEEKRQLGLIAVAERLRSKGVKKVECSTKDVTAMMKGSGSKALSRSASEGVVVCVAAPGLRGLLGWEPSPGVRLGKEAAEVARANSLGGVIHSDEFEKQGVSASEEMALRSALGCAEDSALVLMAGRKEVVSRAAQAVVVRLEAATEGVLAETRSATEEGETRYMRPRPGSQRMYPETDIPDIAIGPASLSAIRRSLPEGWEAMVARLGEDYRLSREMALKLYDSEVRDDFERITGEVGLSPSVVATVLLDVPPRLSREGVPESVLGVGTLSDVIRAVDRGLFTKEAVPDVLRALGRGGGSIESAVASLGFGAAGEKEVDEAVDRAIGGASALIKERGAGAHGPLMGEVMKELRGRADGALVGKRLAAKLEEAIARAKEQS